MGKSAKMPTYNREAAQQEQIQAAELARKYTNVGVQSDTGGYKWVTDPTTGLQRVVVDSAPTDVQRRAIGTTMLEQYDPTAISQAYSGIADFSTDPTAAANAYYNASTRYLTQDYNRQREKAESNLIAKGVPVGSAAYNQAMQELDDSYNRALQTAADTAVSQGQQYQTQALQNELARAGALAGASQQQLQAAQSLTQSQYDPLSQMVQGTGGQFGGTYDAQFSAKTAAAQAKNARRNAWLGAGASLIGTLGGAALGGPIGAALVGGAATGTTGTGD